MKDFFLRNTVFISVVLGTLILLTGGVYLFTKNGTSATPTAKISNDILMPPGSNETSGIVNGTYQPATSSAILSLVEFGDYECPACGAYEPLTKQLMADLTGKVNFVFRNFPLPQHSNAQISSDAAEAAALQGKFWEMHDKLYETQNDWSTSTDAKTIFIGYAKDLGLNVTQFTSDIDSQKVSDKVTKDTNDGNLIGINETPTFYLNGIMVVNLPSNYNDFKTLIQNALTP